MRKKEKERWEGGGEEKGEARKAAGDGSVSKARVTASMRNGAHMKASQSGTTYNSRQRGRGTSWLTRRAINRERWVQPGTLPW